MHKYIQVVRAVTEHLYVVAHYEGDRSEVVETHRSTMELAVIDRLSNGKKRPKESRVRCKPNQRWAAVSESGRLIPIGDAIAPAVKG